MFIFEQFKLYTVKNVHFQFYFKHFLSLYFKHNRLLEKNYQFNFKDVKNVQDQSAHTNKTQTLLKKKVLNCFCLIKIMSVCSC